MLSRENLMGMSSWGGFCGIMFIILGAISAITGVFAFIVALQTNREKISHNLQKSFVEVLV